MTQHLPRPWLRHICLGLFCLVALTWSKSAAAANFCDQNQFRFAEIHRTTEQIGQLFWNEDSFVMGQGFRAHGHSNDVFGDSRSKMGEGILQGAEGEHARRKKDCGRCSMSHIYLAGIALVFLIVLKMRHFTARKRLELARIMVEQGIDPPEHLLGQIHGNDLKRGIVLTCAGVGLLAATGIGGAEKLAPAGLIPIFVGVGYLICHRFARSNRRESH